MQKWKSVIFLTFLALVGLILALGRVAKTQRAVRVASARADVSASSTSVAGPAPSVAEELLAPAASSSASPTDGAQLTTPLPANAPNEVVFGAIIVTFNGAQGASAKSRTKEAAFELAKQIVEKAQTSFEDAVKMGDPGSMANAGSMRRGILEPQVEYALFTLSKGALYPEPVETPRGYWIMRRIR